MHLNLNRYVVLYVCLASSNILWNALSIGRATASVLDSYNNTEYPTTVTFSNQFISEQEENIFGNKEQKRELSFISSPDKFTSFHYPLHQEGVSTPASPGELNPLLSQIPDSPVSQSSPSETVQSNEPPQLEIQPSDLPTPSPAEPIEQKLKPPEVNYTDRLNKLQQRLLRNTLQSSRECGELGCIPVRPVEEAATPLPPERELPPSAAKPSPTFIPIGYLLARASYFHTSNLFSSAVEPKEDGLVYTGLTLSSAPIALGDKTFLTGAVEGNLIRYIDQSTFNSNQLVLRLGVYQQLTQQMFAEFGWINQQLFYAKNSEQFGFTSGTRFFNEHSLRLSLGRRDSLSPKLTLYSLYELRWNLAEPSSRNRLINSLWVSLNYDLQKALQVGLGYQLGYSDFTQRPRNDLQHRIYTHLTYGISDLSNLNLQAGFNLGNSTDRTIDFNGWFVSLNYVWDIGRF